MYSLKGDHPAWCTSHARCLHTDNFIQIPLIFLLVKCSFCAELTNHMPWQPLQNHPSRHFGGWATQWSAEEMLDGQWKRVDISASATTDHNDLMQTRLEDVLLNHPSCPLDHLIRGGTEWTKLNKLHLCDFVTQWVKITAQNVLSTHKKNSPE